MIRTRNYYHNCTENSFQDSNSIDCLANFIKSGSNYKNIKKFVISSDHLKSGSADCVSEIVYTLSTLIDYLAALTDRGFTINELHQQLSFNLSIGSNFFFEIAKFRAFRVLVNQILSDYGFDQEATIDLCARSTTWNKSSMDSHTNLLRTTTEAMSAAIGGAKRIEISPFDQTYSESNEFSLRIARNIQHLLKSESYFDVVSDAAAGSYYIENITDQMVKLAWSRIVDINKNGGFFSIDSIRKSPKRFEETTR